MGKRYGRNQKRKQREAIATLTEQNQSLQRLAVNAAGEAHKLNTLIEQWDDEMRRLLGAYSAFRGYPDHKYVRKMPKCGERHYIPRDMSVFDGPLTPIKCIQDTFARLHLMLFEHSEDKYSLRQLMRTSFIDESGEVLYALAYQIDGKSFLREMVGEREVASLSHQIAESFVRKWQEMAA